jgi:hypothetical protein
MKFLAPGLIGTLVCLPLPAAAVLLDCDISADRIYTCVEIGGSATGAGPQVHQESAAGSQVYGEEYRRYREQAQQRCVYNAPRRRSAGKNTGAALRVEELKSARAEYDQCIRETARKIWLENNPPDTSKP